MGKKKIIIGVVVVVFLIVAIALGVVFGMKMSKGDKGEEDISEKEVFQHDVGELITNISASKKLVKLNPTVETTDEKFLETLTNKNYIIRNEVNDIVRSKSEEEIKGSEAQKQLQDSILKRLNEVFNTKVISNVYFKDFIVQ